MSVNKAIILGRVGNVPETKQLKDGASVINFSVATSQYWFDKDANEIKSNTEWHRVVSFEERTIQYCEKIQKGDMVYVEATIKTRKFGNDDGAVKPTQITELHVNKGGRIEIVSKKNPSDRSFEEKEETEFSDEIPF